MATSTTISVVPHSPSPSLTLRLLNPSTLPQKPPDLNNINAFELHECDVIWSSSSGTVNLPSPPNVSSSPQTHRQFNSGLYAALSDDQHLLVRRKPSITPSRSAATAALTVPPVRRSSEYSPGFHQSAPVNVPVWPKKNSSGYLGFDDVADDEDEAGVIVPPHEIVARSYVTFSVFEGAGRTLKGRDMCRVRNAVFQKTGFID